MGFLCILNVQPNVRFLWNYSVLIKHHKNCLDVNLGLNCVLWFKMGFDPCVKNSIEFVLCGHLLQSLPWIDFCPGFYVFIASANMMEFLGVLLFFISQLIQLQLWPEAELTSLKGWRLYELYPRRSYNGTQIMIGFEAMEIDIHNVQSQSCKLHFD